MWFVEGREPLIAGVRESSLGSLLGFASYRRQSVPQQGTIYRVLVASPSDCIKERILVPDVIHAWNAAHSLPLGVILEPVLWETHARPELGDRPQAIINKQLVENCDILVGTFWTRLGTSTGKAESGTAEEIEEFRSNGKPVLLYFSSAPVVPEGLDAVQYQALTEYRKKLGDQGLHFRYDSLDQLRQLLQGHLAGIMAASHQRSAALPASTQEADREDRSDFIHQYRAQFETFVRRFEAEWVSERDSSPHNIDVGKDILASALEQLLSFRSQVVSGMKDVTTLVDEAARELRGLQRHQLFIDGGKSFRDFWGMGDAVLEKLKSVPNQINKE
ncbi:MAG: hypothetical protein ACK54F_05200 [Planctomycetia bacterium]